MKRINTLLIGLGVHLAEVRERARDESDVGSVTIEKVIITAASALIAIGVMAALKALIDAKIAGISI